jgi:hypothetical protein
VSIDTMRAGLGPVEQHLEVLAQVADALALGDAGVTTP